MSRAFPGLLAATIAINVPHCLLTFGIGRAAAAMGDAPWLRVIKDALVPVTVGLIVAGGVVTGRAADHELLAVCISAATAVFIVVTNRNPMWMLCAGMGAGLASAHLLN
jgi:chromate transporter